MDLVEREEDFSPSTQLGQVGRKVFPFSFYSDGLSRKRGKFLSLYSI